MKRPKKVPRPNLRQDIKILIAVIIAKTVELVRKGRKKLKKSPPPRRKRSTSL